MKPPSCRDRRARSNKGALAAAMDEWYRLARSEWASQAAVNLKYRRPYLRWCEAAGPTSKCSETASALARTWRQLARRGADCAAMLEGSRDRTEAQSRAVEGHHRAIRKMAHSLPDRVPTDA